MLKSVVAISQTEAVSELFYGAKDVECAVADATIKILGVSILGLLLPTTKKSLS